MTAPARPAEAPGGVQARDMAFLVLIQFLFAGNWIASKLGLAEAPPLALMTLRFLVLFLLLMPFLRWHEGHMVRLAAIALAGGACHFGVMFIALEIADEIAPLAIAGNLGIPFATLLSVFFLGERIRFWRTSALVLAFSGVALMAFDPHILDEIEGLVLMTVAAFSWAVSAVLVRGLPKTDIRDLQGWIALGAWPPLLVASLLLEPGAVREIAGASGQLWTSLAYMVICATLIGHGGTYWLLQRYSIAQLAPLMLLAPILAGWLGVVWFGNQLTWQMLVGGALTLGGTLVIMLREGRSRPR